MQPKTNVPVATLPGQTKQAHVTLTYCCAAQSCEGRGWKQGHQLGHSCNGTDEREQQEKTRLQAKAHLGPAIWRSDISPRGCGIQLAQSLLVGRRHSHWGQLIHQHENTLGQRSRTQSHSPRIWPQPHTSGSMRAQGRG